MFKQRIRTSHFTYNYRRVVLLFSTLIVSLLIIIAKADDYSQWNYSTPIFINTSGITATAVYDFPVLIRLNPENFSFFYQTSTGGVDIRFAKSDGTHLPYQIERWVDGAGDYDTAEIWVKLDTVFGNSANQTIMMFWGNAGAVDSSDGEAVFDTANGFIGVWHLNEDPTGGTDAVMDVTHNQNHGTSVGAMSSINLVDGVINKGHSFDGSDDGDSIPYDVSLNSTEAVTVSAWVSVNAFQSFSRIATRGISTNGDPWVVYSLGTNDVYAQLYGEVSTGSPGSNGNVLGVNDMSTGVFYFIALTYDRATMKVYRNGSQDGSDVSKTDAIGTQSTPFMIGKSNVQSNPFSGVVDEVRLSNVARSADWIRLSYENQKNGQSVVTLPQQYNWDISSSAGIQAGSGTWGTDSYWTKDSTTLIAWPGDGNNAIFSGTDGTYTITVSGTQMVDNISILADGYTFSGGTIDFGINPGIYVEYVKTATIASVIAGSNGLKVHGDGTLVLEASNTYTGPTFIENGSLLINGSTTAASPVTVGYGALIGGEGSILGKVIVQDSGHVAPGNGGSGKLTVDSLLLNNLSVLNFEVGTTSDTITVTGDVTLDGILNISSMAGFGIGTYTLITYAGGVIDNGLTLGALPGGYVYSVEISAGEIRLQVSSASVREWTGGGGNNLWSTAGNWSGSIVPTSSDSVVFPTATTLCSLDVNADVYSLNFTPGYTNNFYLNGKKLTVRRSLSIEMTGQIISNGSDTICFDGSELAEFFPKLGMGLPTIHQKGSGTTTVLTNGFRADNLYISNGEFNLGTGLNDTVYGSLSVDGGILHFGTCTLSTQGDVDLRNASALVHSGGRLAFSGSSPQNFYPGNELPHPSILKTSGMDTVHVRGNRLRVGRLSIYDGAMKFDTSLFADTVELTSSITGLYLDTASENCDTIHTLLGYGTVDFGQTRLHVSSSLDLNGFMSVAGEGEVLFFGTDSIGFTPKNGFTHSALKKYGTGDVYVYNGYLTAERIALYEGGWHWNNAVADSIIDTLEINGGVMKMTSSTVKSHWIVTSGGEIDFDWGTLIVYGYQGSADLSGLVSCTPDSGALAFDIAENSVLHLYSNPSQSYPRIVLQGNATDTVQLNNNIVARALTVYGGVARLGSGLTHDFDTISVYGGTLDFESADVKVSSANVNISSAGEIVPGSGVLLFTASTGKQILSLPSTGTLPAIEKTSTCTLQIASNYLNCNGLTIDSGTFDFNWLQVTVNGNLQVNNGSSTTFMNFAGDSLSILGNASFNGQSGNLLNMDPGANWSLYVSGGTLTADYATIGFCNVYGVTGQAENTCVDNGGNSGWIFEGPDTLPPDNDLQLQTTAQNTTDIEIRWNPSVVDSIDCDSVGIWYKTTDYPDSANDVTATLAGKYELIDSIRTISGLNPHTLYYFAAAVRDSTGNWSPVNTALDSVYTYADPPTVAADLDTVHKKTISLSWNNPSGLAPTDSIYIHWDTVTTNGWILDTTLYYTVNSCDVALPLSNEGKWKVMISTKWDSAGVHYIEDVLIDTFIYAVAPPVVTEAPDTIRKKVYSVSWTNPSGLETDDSIYLHSDTVSGGSWTLDTVLPSVTTSAIFKLQNAEGIYKFMLSTSLDSAGVLNEANCSFDTIVFSIEPPVITTSFDSIESLAPMVTWTAAPGILDGEKYYIYIDTVTGTHGWSQNGVYSYPASSAVVSFGGIGTYVYRVTTSFDSLATIEEANGAVDTLYVVDITAPTAGSIVISDNSGYSADTDPPFSIGVSGADSMRIGLAMDTATATWKVVSVLDSISIVSGGEGLKRIFIQFSDTAGNRSGWIYDSTMYDVTAPSGTVLIVDNSGYTADSDPYLTCNATGADSMRIGLVADTASAVWKVYALSDSIDISFGGDGKKIIGVQYKDNAGNQSLWSIDSTIFDATSPSGTITIIDIDGFTADANPQCIISSTADSMRIGLVQDTSIALWKAVASADSVDISSGGDGKKIVFIQFKDTTGMRSFWTWDTTHYDTQQPVTTIITNGSYTTKTWPGNISGVTADTLSGVDTVKVTIIRESDTSYWNGSNWQATYIIVTIVQVSNWQVNLPETSLVEGIYSIVASSTDRAGNSEAVNCTATVNYSVIPVSQFGASPLVGVQPLTVSFVDSSKGTVTSRIWNFGDGGTDTSFAPVHQYQDPGRYTVSLIVNGPGGSDTLTEDSLIEVRFPPPVARFSQSTLIGEAPLPVQFYDSSSGTITQRLWQFGDGTTDTSKNPLHNFSEAGTYYIHLTVQGPGGIDSVISAPLVVNDTTAPMGLSGLSAIALGCSTIVVSWTPSIDNDVDSISINIVFGNYPDSSSDGDYFKKISSTLTTDTLQGLPSDGVTAYIRLFAIDKAGNWSAPDSQSSIMVVLPDGKGPEYSLGTVIKSVNDSVVVVEITVDSTAEPHVQTAVGFGASVPEAYDLLTVMDYSDTTLVDGPHYIPCWRFVATVVKDSLGNRSSVHYDSVQIKNSAPVVVLLKDTAISEDTLWVGEIRATDFNKDSIWLSLSEAPEGLVLEGNALQWEPDDGAIGRHMVVVTAVDSRNASGSDTLWLTVENREEAPVVTLEGDTAVDENQLYKARIIINDPDPLDTHTVTILRMPEWINYSNKEITGTPGDKDVGTDTLQVAVTDRSGLFDTLVSAITVRNVNDTPVVLSSTIPDSLYEKSTAVCTVLVADPDKHDTLTLFWITSYAWMSAESPIRDTATNGWSVIIRMEPGQRDTGTASFSIRFSDREGAYCVLKETIVVIDADDPPSPPVVSRHIAGGAVQYTISSIDDRDESLLYIVQLRSLTDTTFIENDRAGNKTFSFYPLVDDRYQFRVVVSDQAGNETEPVYDTLNINGSTKMITGDSSWTMFSIPATYENKKLENTQYLLHWDEAIQEQQVYHFYQQKKDIDALEPGKGYWRKGIDKDTITISKDMLLQVPVKIPLTKKDAGWNQIASPYPYPVIWRGKSSVLWKWNESSADFEESDSVLEPWAGYWVQSDITDSVAVEPVPFFQKKSLAKRKRTWFSNKNSWVMRIALTTKCGGDAENLFGVQPEARDGYDNLDRPEPPRIVGTTSLFFPHSDWKRGVTQYASDFRRKWQTINIFEFGITGSSQGGTANIDFEGFDSDVPLYLYMMSGDSLQQLHAEEKIELPVSVGTRYRTIFVVDNPSALKLLPLRFSMGYAFPNPFCPSTRINYVLPYRWGKDGKMVTQDYVVKIEVFDLKGRVVRNLVHRKMRPGNYQAFWDGKGSNGRIVASGHYYCRLKADSFSSVRKMTLVR